VAWHRKPSAIAILVTAAIGLVVLGVAAPGERTLKMHWTKVDDATIAWANELLASPIARLLDPVGHDRLVHALHHEPGELLEGRLDVDDLVGLDPTMATDAHQIAVARTRLAALIALAMIFAGSLTALILFVRDHRSGGWMFATACVVGAMLPITFVLKWGATTAGSVLGLLALAAIGVVGYELNIAMRLRTPDEVPDPPAPPAA
jgi:hypothetical protein